jgi:S-formylglutathione hydrolase FrmB
MSFFTGTIYSDALKMDTNLAVVLPGDTRWHRGNCVGPAYPMPQDYRKPGGDPKMLILLHGLSDGSAAWLLRTSLFRYAEVYDIACVMPEVQRSFYLNMKYGLDYATYIYEELPEICEKLFNVSCKPKDLMLAGLSMGGYGALYGALKYPEKFSVIGSFSGAPDLKSIVTTLAKADPSIQRDCVNIFGDPPVVTEAQDLYALAEKAGCRAKALPLYMTCGAEDFLHDSNVHIRDHLIRLGFNLTYEEWPGIHEWGFWDLSLQKFLKRYLGGD